MNAGARPFVSIVITAYNAEKFIGACVRAALSQRYPHFEVVVVDDGSTDATVEICRAIGDPRVRVLQWGRLGRPKALNRGVAAAAGEYIAINDADDLSLPHRLGYCIDFLLAHPEVAYVGTGFFATDLFCESVAGFTAGAGETDGVPPTWPSRVDVFRRNLFNNSTLMYPKRTWQSIGGYDEALTNSEDYDFYLRALACGPSALLPGRTLLWYTNPNGYFKQKSRDEHLRALRVIKRRAYRVLNLPLWLKFYHPLWRVVYEISARFPRLLPLVRALRRSE